jgi:hypothetical protein
MMEPQAAVFSADGASANVPLYLKTSFTQPTDTIDHVNQNIDEPDVEHIHLGIESAHAGTHCPWP